MGVSSREEVWFRHNADEICTREEREESETDRPKMFNLNFPCLVLKYEFHFIVSSEFPATGTTSWKSLPSIHPAPGWRSHASSQDKSEGQQGAFPSPPHSSACPAPLALVMLGCWALRLCGCDRENVACGAFLVTSYAIGLLVSLQGGTWTFMQSISWETLSWRKQAEIKIAGRNINNLRYADDTTLMTESEEELKTLLM